MPISKNQYKLMSIIRSILRCHAVPNFRGFEWLKTNNGGKQEIDIWVPSLKLAIEYDGEQHFRPVKFGGISDKQAKINFKRTKILDELKDKKILDHPDDIKHYIRFNYKENMCREYIENRLVGCGIQMPTGYELHFDDMLNDAINPSPCFNLGCEIF